MNFFFSPFIIPVAGIMVAIVAIISGAMNQAHARRTNAEQRLIMLQRGMTPEQIALLINPAADAESDTVKTSDPLRSLGNARRAGIVLVSVGLGIVFFGVVLAAVVRDRETLIVAAAGLIPLAIGIGFFVDYNLQKRELSRFGLEVAADQPAQNRTS